MENLECVRRGCTNCNCKTNIPNVGNICKECISEFKKDAKESFKYNLETEGEVVVMLEEFIDSPKLNDNFFTKVESLDEYFEKYTSK